jgi:hypothetical protein
MARVLFSTFVLAQSIKMTTEMFSFRVVAQESKPHLQQKIYGKKDMFHIKLGLSFSG